MLKIKSRYYIIILLLSLANIFYILSNNNISDTTSENTIGKYVIPLGYTCGLQIDVDGALVVGTEKNSQLETGDFIIAINDHRVSSPKEISEALNNEPGRAIVKVSRNNQLINVMANTYYDQKTKSYLLGAWIKEKTAGIGTLSFYNPANGKYAAVGHGIIEPETNNLLQVKTGQLLNCLIDNIEIGENGKPGEICGSVYEINSPIGSIEKNTQLGIYGEFFDNSIIKNKKSYRVANIEEVSKGEAYILTSLDGLHVTPYKIKITKCRKQSEPSTKGIEFKVIDPNLVNETGGIIQGMSGSPIIQNDLLIGCVTHVFNNNPQKGYGIYASFMYDEMMSK